MTPNPQDEERLARRSVEADRDGQRRGPCLRCGRPYETHSVEATRESLRDRVPGRWYTAAGETCPSGDLNDTYVDPNWPSSNPQDEERLARRAAGTAQHEAVAELRRLVDAVRLGQEWSGLGHSIVTLMSTSGLAEAVFVLSVERPLHSGLVEGHVRVLTPPMALRHVLDGHGILEIAASVTTCLGMAFGEALVAHWRRGQGGTLFEFTQRWFDWNLSGTPVADPGMLRAVLADMIHAMERRERAANGPLYAPGVRLVHDGEVRVVENPQDEERLARRGGVARATETWRAVFRHDKRAGPWPQLVEVVSPEGAIFLPDEVPYHVLLHLPTEEAVLAGPASWRVKRSQIRDRSKWYEVPFAVPTQAANPQDEERLARRSTPTLSLADLRPGDVLHLDQPLPPMDVKEDVWPNGQRECVVLSCTRQEMAVVSGDGPAWSEMILDLRRFREWARDVLDPPPDDVDELDVDDLSRVAQAQGWRVRVVPVRLLVRPKEDRAEIGSDARSGWTDPAPVLAQASLVARPGPGARVFVRAPSRVDFTWLDGGTRGTVQSHEPGKELVVKVDRAVHVAAPRGQPTIVRLGDLDMPRAWEIFELDRSEPGGRRRRNPQDEERLVRRSGGCAASTDDLVREIRAWWKAKEPEWGDLGWQVTFWAPAEWRRKGEDFANDAPLVMTSEGGFNRILAYPETRADDRLVQEWTDLLAALGWRWQMETAWAFSFRRARSNPQDEERLARRGATPRGTEAYLALAAKSAEIGWPEAYKADLHEHDRGRLERQEPRQALWAVSDTGTELLTDVDLAVRPISRPGGLSDQSPEDIAQHFMWRARQGNETRFFHWRAGVPGLRELEGSWRVIADAVRDIRSEAGSANPQDEERLARRGAGGPTKQDVIEDMDQVREPLLVRRRHNMAARCLSWDLLLPRGTDDSASADLVLALLAKSRASFSEPCRLPVRDNGWGDTQGWVSFAPSVLSCVVASRFADQPGSWSAMVHAFDDAEAWARWARSVEFRIKAAAPPGTVQNPQDEERLARRSSPPPRPGSPGPAYRWRTWQDGMDFALRATEEEAAVAEASAHMTDGHDPTDRTFWVHATLQRGTVVQVDHDRRDCPQCFGTGWFDDQAPCPRCDGTGEVAYEGLSDEERTRTCLDCGAYMATFRHECQVEWEDWKELRKAVDPEEPGCDDASGHEWDDRGVRASGGGTVHREECTRCGLRREYDTWAQDPVDGTQGHQATRYAQPGD